MKTIGISLLLTVDMESSPPCPLISAFALIHKRGESFTLSQSEISEFKKVILSELDKLPKTPKVIFQD